MSQTKGAGYDHPMYLARMGHAFTALAAGANGVTSKFVAFANLQVFGIQAAVVAVGSSTYTAYNGTATVTGIAADQISLIRIMNNAAPGAAPSMSTATYGPFAVAPYNGTLTGTQTSAIGITPYYSLYGTGTTGQLQAGAPAGSGGISVNSGDQLYILRGTDASAVTGVSLDYGITPLANVGA
jgi:hypothetical protein